MKRYKSLLESIVNLKDIYTLQSYIDPQTVEEKRKNKDYEIQISQFKDDNKKIWILVDGNHSYQASLLDHAKPDIKIVKSDFRGTFEQYVTAFGDLSNPVNIVTEKEWW